MTGTCTVRVVCFSFVKKALQKPEVSLELPEDSTGADLDKRIRELAEGKLDGIPMRLAVNRRFVPADTVLNDGDEVALIPPVQGG